MFVFFCGVLRDFCEAHFERDSPELQNKSVQRKCTTPHIRSSLLIGCLPPSTVGKSEPLDMGRGPYLGLGPSRRVACAFRAFTLTQSSQLFPFCCQQPLHLCSKPPGGRAYTKSRRLKPCTISNEQDRLSWTGACQPYGTVSSELLHRSGALPCPLKSQSFVAKRTSLSLHPHPTLAPPLACP